MQSDLDPGDRQSREFASRDRLAPRMAELARKLEIPTPAVIEAVHAELQPMAAR